jgi:hypothetical protein
MMSRTANSENKGQAKENSRAAAWRSMLVRTRPSTDGGGRSNAELSCRRAVGHHHLEEMSKVHEDNNFVTAMTNFREKMAWYSAAQGNQRKRSLVLHSVKGQGKKGEGGLRLKLRQ